jgi:putative phage-type endonuclease
MMEIIKHEQGSQAWIDWRRTKRMASEASVVTGRSPWTKPIQLARQKRGLEEFKTNYAMKRGTQFESDARRWFESEMGLLGNPEVIGFGEYGASLDWISRDVSESGEQSNVVIAEFKVPQSENSELWRNAGAGLIPEYYVDQMTQQWAVSGAEKGYFCVYMPELGYGKIIEFKYNPDRWSEIQQAWDAFWETYMVGDLPEEVRTDEAWANAVTRYRDAKLLLDEAQERIDSIKDELIELANKQSAKGCGITLSRVEKSGSVKWAEIAKELKPSQELIQKYTGKSSVSFTINLK